MKKTVYILLFAAFLIQSVSQVCILAIFKLRQEYIASELCVNRFEAIPICKGSCFLEDQLNKDRQEQGTPNLKIKEVNIICQQLPQQGMENDFPDTCEPAKYPLVNSELLVSGFLHGVFRPPSLNSLT